MEILLVGLLVVIQECYGSCSWLCWQASGDGGCSSDECAECKTLEITVNWPEMVMSGGIAVKIFQLLCKGDIAGYDAGGDERRGWYW